MSSGFVQVAAWLKLRRDRDNLPVPLSPESCGRGANTVAGLICDGRTGTTPSMTSDSSLADSVSGPSHPPSASGAGSPPRHRPFTKRRRGLCSKIHGCRRLDRQLGGHTSFDAEIGPTLFNGDGNRLRGSLAMYGRYASKSTGKELQSFFRHIATVGDELPPPYSVGHHTTGPGDPRTNLAACLGKGSEDGIQAETPAVKPLRRNRPSVVVPPSERPSSRLTDTGLDEKRRGKEDSVFSSQRGRGAVGNRSVLNPAP